MRFKKNGFPHFLLVFASKKNNDHYMTFKKLFLIISFTFFTFSIHAQDSADSETENTPTNTIPSNTRKRVINRGNARSYSTPADQESFEPPVAPVQNDYLRPGWNSQSIQRGVGFSGSFLGAGNAFIFETGLDRPSSWTFYFSFAKSSDTFTESSTTSTSGVAPAAITTTTSTTLTGVENPFNIGIGTAYNRRLYRNSFFLARLGFFGGIDYFTDVSYGTGTSTNSQVSTTPGTVTNTQTNFGEVKVTRDPVIRLGPVFDAYVFLRWIPHLAVGFQGGVLYTTPLKTETTTNTTTQTFETINGVDQTPTAFSSSNQSSTANGGGTGSTFAIAGQNFNLLGNFVIRYVW